MSTTIDGILATVMFLCIGLIMIFCAKGMVTWAWLSFGVIIICFIIGLLNIR